MFWLIALLLTVQSPPSISAPGMTPVFPEGREVGRCLDPLAADGSVNMTIMVRCAAVQDGEPRDCQLQPGAERPKVRQRAAARCLAALYRFNDASGQPATGGEVTIPITLQISVR